MNNTVQYEKFLVKDLGSGLSLVIQLPYDWD